MFKVRCCSVVPLSCCAAPSGGVRPILLLLLLLILIFPSPCCHAPCASRLLKVPKTFFPQTPLPGWLVKNPQHFKGGQSISRETFSHRFSAIAAFAPLQCYL